MHGITLTSGPSDWEIIQQENGVGSVRLCGKFNVHPAALEVGVESVRPIVRVMGEADNETVIPWTPVKFTSDGNHFTGFFETELEVPAGGLYRIETSLETKSTVPDLTWLYRGDCILHLGVGNLFLIAGQSNAAGYGRDYAMDPPHMCVHLFRNRSCWDLASHPMNESTAAGSLPNEEMGIPGVSPYLSFGRKYYELTGMPVGLIQTARGGMKLSHWDPVSGEMYRNMVDKIRLTGGKYAGVLWYQGCEDANPTEAPLYLERFQSFLEALREELGYEIPFFTSQLNRFVGGTKDEAWGRVREAQRQASCILPGVYLLPTTNCSISDGVHNSAHGNIMLGERLARQCYYRLNGGEVFAAPELGTATLTEDTRLCLTFENVRLGFQIFSGRDTGFTLEDENGPVAIEGIHSNRQDQNRVYLELARKPEGKAYLSFAWEADPVRLPLVDEVTYLPPVSFFGYRIL